MKDQFEQIKKLQSKIIVKAWKDPVFKKLLLKNPKAALKQLGIELPKDLIVNVVEEKQGSFTFVLPAAPHGDMTGISDERMEQIHGGSQRRSVGCPGCKSISPL